MKWFFTILFVLLLCFNKCEREVVTTVWNWPVGGVLIDCGFTPKTTFWLKNRWGKELWNKEYVMVSHHSFLLLLCLNKCKLVMAAAGWIWPLREDMIDRRFALKQSFNWKMVSEITINLWIYHGFSPSFLCRRSVLINTSWWQQRQGKIDLWEEI